jgi:hypothetical protein
MRFYVIVKLLNLIIAIIAIIRIVRHAILILETI